MKKYIAAFLIATVMLSTQLNLVNASAITKRESIKSAATNFGSSLKEGFAVDSTSETAATRVDKFEIPVGTINKLKLDVSLGDIIVVPTDSDKITAEVTLKVNSNDATLNKNILDNITSEQKTKDNTLSIAAYHKNTTTLASQWISKTYNQFNIGLNSVVLSEEYKIYVPKATILEYGLTSSLGDITMSDVKGYFNVVTSLGDVSLTNVSLTKNSNINTSLGDVTVDIAAATTNVSSVTIQTSLGDVDVTLSKSIGATIKCNNDVSYNNNSKSITNGNGKMKVNISTSLGSANYKFK